MLNGAKIAVKPVLRSGEYGFFNRQKALINLKAKNRVIAAIAEYQKKIYGYDLISARKGIK